MTDKNKAGIAGIIDDIMGDDVSEDEIREEDISGNKGGSTRHELTNEERSRGGKVSASKQDMKKLGRKGGKA